MEGIEGVDYRIYAHPIRGAKQFGSWIEIPRDGESGAWGGMRVSIKKAIELGYFVEEEHKILKQFGNGYQKTGTPRTGRPKGTKNYAGRAANEKDIKRLLGHAEKAVHNATIISEAHTLDAIAKTLLGRVATFREYNEYTGNLSNAFAATVIKGNSPTHTYWLESEKGHIYHGKRGGKFAYLMKQRHYTKHKKTKSNVESPPLRYLKKWEKEEGYVEPMGRHPIYGLHSQNVRQAKSGVVITNNAPYAPYVHQAGYNVLRGSTMISKLQNHTAKLVRTATLASLRAAGFEVK